MLDPYYIVNLTPSADHKKSGTYETKFRVPDRVGVFKFIVEHWRYGYSFLNNEVEVSII
jgi:oligosaccharyltransferase complex subunit beta